MSSELPLHRRLFESVGVAALVHLIYVEAGKHVDARPAPLAHVVDAWIPFLPETVWIYLPGYWFLFLLTLWTLRDTRQFRAALLGFLALLVLALPFFAVWPVAAPRPPTPTDPTLTASLVRWLYAHDPVGNTFPSLHVANAAFCSAVTLAANRRVGRFVTALAAAVCVSVLTMKQHWAIDVLGGLAIATIGVAVWHARLAAPDGALLARVLARRR